jgi:molybdopterin/thiamine biosynthesis adenylyltransferase
LIFLLSAGPAQPAAQIYRLSISNLTCDNTFNPVLDAKAGCESRPPCQPAPTPRVLLYTTEERRHLDEPTSIMSQHPPTPADESSTGTALANDHGNENDRYSRQILFPGIGPTGQHLLSSAHVAIVGVGATGAAAAALLARAGVGTLTLIDRDFVESSNLQRQILFDEADARDSLPKAEAARRKIALFNSTITVHPLIADLVPANIHELLASAHLVLDATDNFETRYLLNDYCVQQSKPWIYAAAIGAYAATMNILPCNSEASSSESRHSERSEESLYLPLRTERSDVPIKNTYTPTACLACIFPKPPTGPVETCDTAGILSTAVNLAASIQVTEALKLLTNQPNQMRRTLLSHDLWTNDRSEINTSTPNPDCPVCAHRIFTHLAGEGRPHITLCGRNSVQIHEHHRPVDFAAMRDRLTPHGTVRFNNLLLRFERPPHTLTLFPDGRALIQGTTDITLARSLYARFIGS